jgi:peptidoglycan/xylan/chitin deacetylase (PgdA/CDA1 family)
MLDLKKYRKYCKNILLVIIFGLLTISITKDLMRIYATSSTQVQENIFVPIMMYHQVKNSGLGKDVISPTEFESDLKFLSENNFNTITMTELIAYVYDGKELPENPIILTFDDGYLTTYKYVFPLLKKYNMKIVLSIIGKSTDDFSRVKDENINYSHLTWDQILEMVDSGLVEIQNHSYDLHSNCNGRYGCCQKKNECFEDYEEFLEEDIMKLQSKIQSVINKSPSTFTYPFGKYNNDTEAIVKKLGFKATLSVTYGINVVKRGDSDSLYELKRICRSHNQGISKLIKEGMKTIKNVSEQ